MRTAPRALRYPIALAAGVCFVLTVRAVAMAAGHPSVFNWVDLGMGLLGAAFGISLVTGLNLGIPVAIKSTDGAYSAPTNVGAGLWLILFSLPALVVRLFG